MTLEKRYKTLRNLSLLGWRKEELALFSDQKMIDDRIGSPVFLRFWKKAQKTYPGKVLLKIILDMSKMPLELSGELSETQVLLKRFHPDLSPDASFWPEFAALVNQTFPERTLGKEGTLEKRLHQFRYLISSQQAQYIRDHFGKGQKKDSQALADFLRAKKGPTFWRKAVDYSLSESSRLHNKLKIEDNRVQFPDNDISYNIKLLMGFHTEFILDDKGKFLNELDAEKMTEKGIVNGASFNYGTAGQRHWDLDVDPIRKHDPQFRRLVARGYRSPKHIVKKWYQRQLDDFEHSYFNKKGIFGYGGKSSYHYVKKQSWRYKWFIRYLKLLSFFKKYR
ncbi:DUF3114 domain-containing protein [Streptococcus uberis]|uniref:DUF3114 domain-containing protein n=1 Tax=Streptococcus uberis TaxID=1349 RepID=UPI000B291499|nr:DUF3114 domain-containing protein [Streptococcus uberis]AUC24649.1 hypothetical protein CGZ53_02930 [Streptococcus uberis]MCK1161242.1 DUF3114 domain-containing protein [Streptococcus uberis]MCK1188539.1 DUF3114 domain-containing protein [Streptococcus uberis]MCK1190401.1 DUF3114 domain-containing protein [Streptococcus uberis]MCK1207030.1 DUF3114 domain-containing protein [Streptococcus uberis]